MRNPKAILSACLCFVGYGLFAQGSAFTYQGQLQNNGSPASGTYNFTFSLFNTNTGGSSAAGPVTNNGVIVSNGLFAALIDFGPDTFTGSVQWLEISVETNGANTFITLAPRQQLSPTPYSIMATSASNLLGTLPASQLTGTLPGGILAGFSDSVDFTNQADHFIGTFSGAGGALTNLRASSISGVLDNTNGMLFSGGTNYNSTAYFVSESDHH